MGWALDGKSGDVQRAAAYVSSLTGVIGMLALLAVFVFWGAGNSSAALPYFAVPGVLFVVSAVLGYRALRLPPRR